MSLKHNYKIVLLGEGRVGKSSIVLRYVEDKFNANLDSTIQASFLTKKVHLDNDKRAHLHIWDTAGQERFHALAPIYYRGAHGAILVYDITDRDSFQKVENWAKELQRMLGAEIVIIIAGNKLDLKSQRTVTVEEASEFAERVGAHYVETSAKLDEGIEELFHTLIRGMWEHEAAIDTKREQQASLNNNTNRLQLEDDDLDDGDARYEAKAPTTGGCCSG